MYICIVAPYCPACRGGLVALGAAAKISAVVEGLCKNGAKIRLINSGHQTEKSKCNTVIRSRFENYPVAEIQPISLPFRPGGKLLQCLIAPLLACRIVLSRKKCPEVLWIYNAYLYETIFLITAKLLRPTLKAVLELEDLPMARRRRGTGHIKTLLDKISLCISLYFVDGITVVQNGMLAPLGRLPKMIWYLPVLITQAGAQIKVPKTNGYVIGYFGGLSAEKGVDHLLEVIKLSPSHCRWVIGGTGDLEDAVKCLACTMPQRLLYLGTVNSSEFRSAYEQVDVIVNLHRPLEIFSSGIFPYKLLEAVAAAKIVISTVAKGCPHQVYTAIHWINENPVFSCVDALDKLSKISRENWHTRIEAQRWVLSQFTARDAMRLILTDLNTTSREMD